MIIKQQIHIKCPECGETDFQQPENIQDDDFVTCNNCKFEITVGDLKELGFHQAEPQIRKELDDIVQNTFKSIFKKR